MTNWECVYCGTTVECVICNPDTANPATRDHIIPRSRGGLNLRENLIIACGPCNEAKGRRLGWPEEDGHDAVLDG